jgi:hypothetical protein
VEALMSMMIGASMSTPKEKATPKAARLNLGSMSLAMIAARIGPSAAIINHVAASGTQKIKIFLYVRDSFSAIIAIKFNGK